jgi:hypothetical protein
MSLKSKRYFLLFVSLFLLYYFQTFAEVDKSALQRYLQKWSGTQQRPYFSTVWEWARSQLSTRFKGKSFRNSLPPRNKVALSSFPDWLKNTASEQGWKTFLVHPSFLLFNKHLISFDRSSKLSTLINFVSLKHNKITIKNYVRNLTKRILTINV